MAIDPNALRQILLNLLDNAVKYGPRGQTDSRRRVEHATGGLTLAVEDEGPGVPRRRGSRGSGSRSGARRDRPKAGTGLGLAIVRELVTLHGGTVAVESAGRAAPGSSSTLAAPSAPTRPPTAADPAGQPA